MSCWWALAQCQLLGGTALAALDRDRADVAAGELSAVAGVPATTAGTARSRRRRSVGRRGRPPLHAGAVGDVRRRSTAAAAGSSRSCRAPRSRAGPGRARAARSGRRVPPAVASVRGTGAAVVAWRRGRTGPPRVCRWRSAPRRAPGAGTERSGPRSRGSGLCAPGRRSARSGLPSLVRPPRRATRRPREHAVIVIRRAQRRHAPPPLVLSRRTIGVVEPHHSQLGSATRRTPPATSSRMNAWVTAWLRVVPQVRNCGS